MRGSSLPRHPAQHELSPFARKGTPSSVERFATTPAILDLDRMRDNAPHTAEGWAVLRNTHEAPSYDDDRMKCDGRLLLLAFPGIADATGRSIA
jgi:hypothetical protein